MGRFDTLQSRYDAQEPAGYWEPLEDDREDEDDDAGDLGEDQA